MIVALFSFLRLLLGLVTPKYD